jgi:hypothetical protein
LKKKRKKSWEADEELLDAGSLHLLWQSALAMITGFDALRQQAEASWTLVAVGATAASTKQAIAEQGQ